MNDIKVVLQSLNDRYDEEQDLQYLQLYSKMSVIEFCGWIEVSFDEIWKQYVNRVISNDKIKEYLIKTIDDNYGFEYTRNIQKTFCTIIGGKNWQTLLTQLENNRLGSSSDLKSILNDFSKRRNSFAHTTIGLPITCTYDSPSIAINNYNKLRPILMQINTIMSNL